MTNVFIDGKAGTTGLRIYERLENRPDINLLLLSDEQRKDPVARKEKINQSDITFLCLPDDAARESVSLIENPLVKVIDASTAHRTMPDWAYGFPELSKQHREAVINSKRTAVPGCHASGFVALVYPLVSAGILPKKELVSCFSITGYSGGGTGMIAEYQAENRLAEYDAPRQYATAQMHKHLKEMAGITGLETPPVFSPVVADYYSGMQVSIPLHKGLYTAEQIAGIYAEHYAHQIFVRVLPFAEKNQFCAANKLSGLDGMELSVHGNDDRILLMATFDNLGKGASGAAVQCMNLMTGMPEDTGLKLS